MFSNEDPAKTFSGSVFLPVQGPVTAYDAMENQLVETDGKAANGGIKIALELRPYESIVLIADAFEGMVKKPRPPRSVTTRVLDGEWILSIATAQEYPRFHDQRVLDGLHNIGKIWPDFSGFMRYEKHIELVEPAQKQAVLTIEDAYEGVEVWVNDQYAGMKICPPYAFDVSGLFRQGQNTLKIEVANTLFRKVSAESNTPNFFGPRSVVVEPSGIIGTVTLTMADNVQA